ncbi:MAG: GDSL-like Lipase/Acylhydrolase [Chloroflexi bacterium ADurb.Bin325]|nr:MAG: GDSL-like Lipase/Acylhydrolase [Chloroflexi bacterium ADurb.Bin325]
MGRVLLIGDSITGGFPNSVAGYGPEARELLAGAAQVDTLPENGGDSRNLLARLSGWLGDARYDVIHFNCGLHDIKRPHSGAGIQVPIDEYEANLHALVDRLQPRAARLIWARITPVVDGQPAAGKDFDRYNADIDAYNRVADRVMAARGVAVDDLHAAVCAAGLAICLADDGVHMTAAGNHVLARQAAALLRASLSAAG